MPSEEGQSTRMIFSVLRKGAIKFGLDYFACFIPGTGKVENYKSLIYISLYLLSVAEQISVFDGNN